MLSGACILTPRAVVERVGRFDPGYFLYYEDADWCRRVRRAGYSLAYVPEAEIIHYYNQSAKADPGEAQRHAIESQERFVDAYYGWPGRSVLRAALGLGSRLARRWGAIPLPGLVDLGRIAEPPRLRVPHAPPHREAVIELAYDWLFVPSVAAFVGAADFRLSPSVWERMQPGRYYARLTDPQTLRPLALWSWEKG
jgi:GT2 family glycosyltransferase